MCVCGGGKNKRCVCVCLGGVRTRICVCVWGVRTRICGCVWGGGEKKNMWVCVGWG